MKMKKLLAATCAGAMALSLTVPAFAVDPQPFGGKTTNFTSEIAKDDIGTVSVDVPASATLYVNPYGALIQLNDGSQTFGTGNTAVNLEIKQGSVSDTMFSQTRLVQNTGDQALDLKVVVKSTDATGGTTSNGKFVTMNKDGSTGFETTVATADGAPELMGFFEIKDATVTNGVVAPVTWTVFDQFAATSNSAKTGMVAISDAAASATATPAGVCYTLPAATTDEIDDGYGGTTEVIVPSYAAFHLVGKVNPNVTAAVWSSDETALPTVDVIFTFTPATVAP